MTGVIPDIGREIRFYISCTFTVLQRHTVFVALIVWQTAHCNKKKLQTLNLFICEADRHE